MKRMALVFSAAMLLSGASVFAMEKDADVTEEVTQKAQKAQKAPKDPKKAFKLPTCEQLNGFATDRRVWLGSAAALVVGTIAYKLYKNYKKNAAQETEETTA